MPFLTARSWIIYDVNTNNILRGYKHFESREIASLTKIMTCFVSLKLIKRFNLDPKKMYFSVSHSASSITGTSACLDKGEWVLIEDLLYALMLPSGNDAALVLAENFGCLLYFNSIG